MDATNNSNKSDHDGAQDHAAAEEGGGQTANNDIQDQQVATTSMMSVVALARELDEHKRPNRTYASVFNNFVSFLEGCLGEDEVLQRPYVTVENVNNYFARIVSKKATVLPRSAGSYLQALKHYAEHDSREIEARSTFKINVS